MKITALDIRQKTFEKSFRGIDKDEVQAFLTTLSQQWERMGEENRELRLKLEHAQHDVQKLREVESSLYRTLKTAEDTGQSITEQAQRDADLRRREAQLHAEQTLAEARQRARAIVDEAYQKATTTVADMQKEVGTLGQECQRLEQHLETLVRDLHHLATEALEKAQRATQRPKAGAAAILSKAASVQVERPQPEPAAPETIPAMHVTTASSAAVPVATPATAGHGFAPAAERSAIGFAPAAYNPKPGQQPDPRNPDQAPGPDIERPQAPRENPGVSPAPNVPEPGPETVPNAPSPYVEPARPEIGPIGPGRPEIQQPEPNIHPGMQVAPATEKSFFDEL